MASGSQNNTTYQAQKWTNLRAFTIGDTAKNVDGTAAVSWSKDEILGASTDAYFLRGDKVWSHSLSANFSAGTYILAGTYLQAKNHIYMDAGHFYMKYNNTWYDVLHNHSNGNISVNAAGTGLYVGYYNTTLVDWMSGRMQLKDGCLSIFPNSSNYREGIRIHSVGSWSDITLCGNDNTGDSGISANSWFIGNNNGNFYISRNASSVGSGLRCVSNMWSVANMSTSSAAYSTAALQIREYNHGGAQTDNWQTAPRLGFHWSNRNAAQIGLASNGYLYECPGTGTTFYKLVYESGTWGISISGNAATATALTSNAGGGEQPIYFTGGKPAATSYALKATVNNGTASRIAYYSAARAISSGSIVTDGGYLGSVSYLSINKAHQTSYRLWVQGSTLTIGHNELRHETYDSKSATNGLSSNTGYGWYFQDKNGRDITRMLGYALTNGQTRLYLQVRNYDVDTARDYAGIILIMDKAGTISYSVSNAANFRSAISAPSTTGSGASGTWGISVTGSSASCTGNAATASKVGEAATWLYFNHGNEVNFGGTGTATDIYFGYRATDSRPKPTTFHFGSDSATVKAATFVGALTGNASTATTLQTARNINGTSFNGSANITTANWGTARNFTIKDYNSNNAGTAVSVNGSGAVTLLMPSTIYCADVRSAKTRIVSDWIGFYQSNNAGGNRYGYIECNADRMYFRKENSSTQDHYFDFGSPLYVNGAIGCAGAITTASALLTGSGITIRRDPSSGNCKIWFATNAAVNKWRIGVDGNDRFAISAYEDGEGNYDFWVYNNGACYYKTSIGASSRYIKHNIRSLTMNTGNIIDRMEPVSFVFNNDPKETTNLGFIYEDLVKILPEVCFHGEGEDNNLGINYSGIIPVLVKEIQSLRKRVAFLEGGGRPNPNKLDI